MRSGGDCGRPTWLRNSNSVRRSTRPILRHLAPWRGVRDAPMMSFWSRIDCGAETVASQCCPAVCRPLGSGLRRDGVHGGTRRVVGCRETTSAAIVAYNGTQPLLTQHYVASTRLPTFALYRLNLRTPRGYPIRPFTFGAPRIRQRAAGFRVMT
jgi:hypothetical protein